MVTALDNLTVHISLFSFQCLIVAGEMETHATKEPVYVPFALKGHLQSNAWVFVYVILDLADRIAQFQVKMNYQNCQPRFENSHLKRRVLKWAIL